MAVNTAKQDFGVGTNDLYGVQEAEKRRSTAKERAEGYAAEKNQNIFTETANKYQNRRADWANTNKTARGVYEQQEYDFANATNLNDYYNDTAGAFGGSKNFRNNKFGKKDYEYLQKMGVKEDVLNNYIGGLDSKSVHENFRNNELASHIHADGWNSGSRFRKDDHQYIKDNNLNLVDEIFKHGENRKGGYNYLDKGAINALEDAGRLEEFDSMYGRGYDKEKGISSRNMKKFSSADAKYLLRQGHTNQEILDDLVDRWHGEKNTKANYWGAKWLKDNNMLDEYTARTRGAQNGQPTGGDTITNTETNTSTNTANNEQNTTSNASVNAELTNTISNNITQNIGNKGDMTTSFGNNATINNSQIGNDNSQNTGTVNLDNNINSNMNIANQSQANSSASFDLEGFKKSLKSKMNGGLNFSEFKTNTADDKGGLNFDKFKTNPYMNGGGFNLNQSQYSS